MKKNKVKENQIKGNMKERGRKGEKKHEKERKEGVGVKRKENERKCCVPIFNVYPLYINSLFGLDMPCTQWCSGAGTHGNGVPTREILRHILRDNYRHVITFSAPETISKLDIRICKLLAH